MGNVPGPFSTEAHISFLAFLDTLVGRHLKYIFQLSLLSPQQMIELRGDSNGTHICLQTFTMRPQHKNYNGELHTRALQMLAHRSQCPHSPAFISPATTTQAGSAVQFLCLLSANTYLSGLAALCEWLVQPLVCGSYCYKISL